MRRIATARRPVLAIALLSSCGHPAEEDAEAEAPTAVECTPARSGSVTAKVLLRGVVSVPPTGTRWSRRRWPVA